MWPNPDGGRGLVRPGRHSSTHQNIRTDDTRGKELGQHARQCALGAHGHGQACTGATSRLAVISLLRWNVGRASSSPSSSPPAPLPAPTSLPCNTT